MTTNLFYNDCYPVISHTRSISSTQGPVYNTLIVLDLVPGIGTLFLFLA